MQKIAIVTGASTGIGKDTAIRLANRGVKVYAAARRVELIETYANENIVAVKMDVTDDQNVRTCIQDIVEREGRIDFLINNAGYGSYGAIEDVPISEGEYQFDVNVIGVARLIQTVLPTMRAQNSGKIVNISSIGGKIYEPLGSWYHATKFAIEGMSDCLRLELEPHGIDVIIIEPGPIITEWNKIARENLMKTSGAGAYKEQAQTLSALLAEYDTEEQGTKSDVVAETIENSLFATKPKTRYPSGKMAKQLMFMRKIVSDKTMDRIMKRVIKNGAKKQQ